MNQLSAIVKLLRGVLHIFKGLWIIRWRFPAWSETQRHAMVETWAQRLLVLWGVTLVVRGTPPAGGPVLLVANHISWLDIVVMHAARHCRFVSKADVKHWPVIGTLAHASGTVFIERESRRDAMRVVHHMADALRQGEVLAVFPEGTTSDGIHLLPFHANLMQAPISADALAQPVALQFIDQASGQRSLAPCYIGDDTLIGSIWRTLTTPGIVAVVSYGEPQRPLGRDRRTWAHDLQAQVEQLRQP